MRVMFLKNGFLAVKPLALAVAVVLTGCGTDSKPVIPNKSNNINNSAVTVRAVAKDTHLATENGTLSYTVEFVDSKILADNTDYEVTYELTGDNVEALLAEPSQKTGKITLNKNKLTSDLSFKLKSDGKAGSDTPITLKLTAANNNVRIDNLLGNISTTVKNTDVGVKIDNAIAIKNEGDAKIQFTIALAPTAVDSDTNVFFDVVSGTAIENVNYKKPAQNFVTIKKGETQAVLEMDLIGPAPTDVLTFNVKLLNTNNGKVQLFDGQSVATGQIQNYTPQKAKRTKLNDTGFTYAGDHTKGTLADCTGIHQDCSQGRDATHKDDADGTAGFSFTKLDKNGNALANDATTWACVKDNVTGLIWETKTFNKDTASKATNDATWEYTYYDSKTQLGTKDTGKGTGRDKETCGNSQDICTTEQYAVSVNASNLCGVNNWRLPTRTELFGVMNISSKKADVVLHKGWLYPNEMDSNEYPLGLWTSSPAASFESDAGTWKFDKSVWLIYSEGTFSAENVIGSWRPSANGVLLVSNGK